MLKIDQKLLYNIPEMDEEHAELIHRAEQVIAAYQNGDPHQEIIRLLAFLQSYVIEHFEHEEALQLRYQFPDRESHQRLHDEFKAEVQALYSDIVKNGLTLHSRLKLNYLVNEWVYKHIGEEDKKLAAHIHQFT